MSCTFAATVLASPVEREGTLPSKVEAAEKITFTSVASFTSIPSLVTVIVPPVGTTFMRAL